MSNYYCKYFFQTPSIYDTAFLSTWCHQSLSYLQTPSRPITCLHSSMSSMEPFAIIPGHQAVMWGQVCVKCFSLASWRGLPGSHGAARGRGSHTDPAAPGVCRALDGDAACWHPFPGRPPAMDENRPIISIRTQASMHTDRYTSRHRSLGSEFWPAVEIKLTEQIYYLPLWAAITPVVL